MFLKILSIVSLLSICIGEQAVKHAISSQSFYRGDVPLSYNYSAVHVYTTIKPLPGNAKYPIKYYKQPEDPLSFRSIQYAPLLSAEELKQQTELHTKISIPKNNVFYQHIPDVTEAPKKDYLEPRIQATKNTEIYPHLLSHKQYIPGHNIEVLQSTNRNPGHNAIYRSYPISGSNEKFNKGKQNMYHRVICEKDQQGKNDVHVEDKKHLENVTAETTKLPAHVVPKVFHVSDNLFRYWDIIPPAGMPQELYPQKPFTKMHALFLNVARPFNQAPVPRRAILRPGASLNILENAPTYTQMFMHAPKSLQPDSLRSKIKTRLFPIQKNTHFAIHS